MTVHLFMLYFAFMLQGQSPTAIAKPDLYDDLASCKKDALAMIATVQKSPAQGLVSFTVACQPLDMQLPAPTPVDPKDTR